MYDHEKGTTIPTFIAGHSHSSRPPAGSRFLPRGWKDLARQVSIWLGFLLGYEVVSSFAGHRPAEAFTNGLRVVRLENALLPGLLEVTFQRIVDSSWIL